MKDKNNKTQLNRTSANSIKTKNEFGEANITCSI